jgi:hypothetical protein
LFGAPGGWGADPPSSGGQPLELLRREIELRKHELAQIRKQRIEQKSAAERRIAALEAVNKELKKEQAADDKKIAEMENSAIDKAAAEKAAMATFGFLVKELAVQVAELRATVDRAFPHKPGDKPPATSAETDSPVKIEPGVDPFAPRTK